MPHEWDGLTESLREAGAAAATLAQGDHADAADGQAQLAVLTEAALRWYFRGADPDFPHFIEINDTPEIADNLFAAVRGDAAYRLSGNVATLFDFNVSVHGRWAWLGPSQVSGDIGRKDIAIAPDGSFELIISATPREGNWMPLPPDAGYIQIREYHADYTPNRPGIFLLERIGAEGETPPRLTPHEVRTRLDRAAAWARNYMAFHQKAIERLFPRETNALAPPAHRSGGNANIQYGFGRFALKEDEALVLTFDRPDARLWNVQWLLCPWYENADLINRQTGLPGGEAFVNADGRVRVVICARDPGLCNWLDCGGYGQGLFVVRWIWCRQGPETSLEVVPLAALADRLPPDTPQFTPAQRAEQLHRRRMHFAARRR